MTRDEKLRVAIVDDEPLARKRIRSLLKKTGSKPRPR